MKHLWRLALFFVFLVFASAPAVSAAFIGTDFQFSVYSDMPTFVPGDTVTFEASIKNLSSTVMVFGGNVRNAGMGTSAFVNDRLVFLSPFTEDFGFYPAAFADGLDGVTIDPLDTYSFPFFFVDTFDTIPSGSTVSLRPAFDSLTNSAGLLIANIPPTVPNPTNDPNHFDFEVIATDRPVSVAAVSAVPEPDTLALVGLGLSGWSRRRKRTSPFRQ